MLRPTDPQWPEIPGRIPPTGCSPRARLLLVDDQPEFALEGSVFIAGAVIQWLSDQMGFIRTAAESESVAASVPDSGGVYVVPCFRGPRNPTGTLPRAA